MDNLNYEKKLLKSNNVKKVLRRKYKFVGGDKYYDDVTLPLWKGQTIKKLIPEMYSGTNFNLVSYKTKKINNKITLVYQLISKKR